ncbi:acyltransferase [Priestia megaterium]|uniref:acyltransferase n=1 Tax=Priestia megaterium TaxID=1404 RepID=UPI003D040A64
MSKFEIYSIYIKNLFYLAFKKLFYGNKLKFKLLQLLGKSCSVQIRGNGRVNFGRKLYTRSNFHLLVENGKCDIGNNCFFNHNCSITCIEDIKIGDRCTFGNNVVLVDHDHNFRESSLNPLLSGEISIGEGTWVGANVVILRGSKIGRNCVIAAGSIVKGDIPDNSIYLQKREVTIKTK